ncbi:hypothetical protein H4R27_003256 [Coemansia aciculifera]|uniref:Phospholipid/glycerol acyltransferase domain-containing protein n=1 Tax=Coemansia pectinata TaxID=1052879 RepID=A0A9W8LD46_9FUNG|nr:hypothetical protein GGI19_001804 [Coemansia pectinata]KAJ2882715.1 hypothetical protein H4R27_003256 [Coemansia aciculifera]
MTMPQSVVLQSAKARRTNSSPMTLVDGVRLLAFSAFFVGHSIIMNLCQLSVSLLLLPLSSRVCRKFNQHAEHWFANLLVAVTSLWAPTKLVLTGDRELLTSDGSNSAATANGRTERSWFAPAVEHGCIVISNHQTYFDWIIVWILAYLEHCDGYVKIILKADLKHVPVFGWGMRLFDFIFLKRKWADDQQTFTDHMQRIVEHDDPSWLLIFPEGTVVCHKRVAISNKYADKMGYKRPEHTLLPRVNGTRFCLSQLRGRIPYIYDLTIGYEGLKKGDIPEDEYGLVSMYGKCVYPREVHIHVKRYAVADIPDDEEGCSKWMHQVFVEKDARMARFYELGRFPHDHTEDEAIPKGEPVLQAIRDAKSDNLLAEFVLMWIQFLAILTPTWYVLRYVLVKVASAVSVLV